MIAYGHEIHPIPCPRFARTAGLPYHRAYRRLPALPLARCLGIPRLLARPSCRRSRDRHAGAAFFCSNRHSKLGCGRTFPVYWQDVIPYCSLRTCQLFGLLEGRAVAVSAHAAWRNSLPVFSRRTAYRWLARWRDLTSHVRARLGLVAAPPGRSDGHADPMTLRHLAAAFPSAACPIAAFQERLQSAVTGRAF